MDKIFFNQIKSPSLSLLNQYFIGSFQGNYILSSTSIKLLWNSIIYILLQVIDINKPILFLGSKKFYQITKSLGYLWDSPYLVLNKKINFFSFEQSLWMSFLSCKIPILLRLRLFSLFMNIKLKPLFLLCKQYKALRVLLPFFRRSRKKLKLRYTIKFTPINRLSFLQLPSKYLLFRLKRYSFYFFLYKYRYLFNKLSYNKFLNLINLTTSSSWSSIFFTSIINDFYLYTQIKNYNPILFIFGDQFKTHLLNYFYYQNFIFFKFNSSHLFISYNIPFYFYSKIKYFFSFFFNLRKQLFSQSLFTRKELFLTCDQNRLYLMHQYLTSIPLRNNINKVTQVKIKKKKKKLILITNLWNYSVNKDYWIKYYKYNNIISTLLYSLLFTSKKQDFFKNFFKKYFIAWKQHQIINYNFKINSYNLVSKLVLHYNKYQYNNTYNVKFYISNHIFNLKKSIQTFFFFWNSLKKIGYIYFYFLQAYSSSFEKVHRAFFNKNDFYRNKYIKNRKQKIYKQFKMVSFLFSKYFKNWFYYYYISNFNLKIKNNEIQSIFSTFQYHKSNLNKDFNIKTNQLIITNNFLWNKFYHNSELLVLYNYGFNLQENKRFYNKDLIRTNGFMHQFFNAAFKRNYYSFFFISGFYLKWTKRKFLNSFKIFEILRPDPLFNRLRFSWRRPKNFQHFTQFKRYLWDRLNRKWSSKLLN